MPALSGLKFGEFTALFKLFHMTTQLKGKKRRNGIKRSSLQSGHSLLYTVNPQDYMEGPLSSVMYTIKEEAEKNDTHSKETSRRRVEHMQ